jgi:hypothetical protein
VVVFFLVNRPGPPPPPPSTTSTAQVLAALTSLPTSELDQVGTGGVDPGKLKAISDSPLTSGGKPEVLFMGAEYCPYCAAERWALIVALSRFGTFSGLATATSSNSDVYPNTPTWTFRHAALESQYLAFVSVEEADNQGNALQQPTADETALGSKYGGDSIPFVDFGNRIYLEGATYFPADLQGLTWAEIAHDLQDPSTSQAKEILGSANILTAAICRATGDQPAAVCSDPVIQRIESALPKSP